jgi:hypothetical protein
MRNADLDGIVFEDEIEDIPESLGGDMSQDPDDMMVDLMAQEEEQELDAMVSMFEAQSSGSPPPARPESPSLSDDDDYDNLFMNLLSQQQQQQDCSQSIVSSGQMDTS